MEMPAPSVTAALIDYKRFDRCVTIINYGHIEHILISGINQASFQVLI